MASVTEQNGTGKTTSTHHVGDSPPPRLVRFGDVLGAFRADAQAAFDARVNGVSRGPGTGLRELDDVLGGVLQPGVHIVQGGSGVGKTAYALQVAATCGYPALFVSCEMHLVELLKRHTARATSTYLDRLKSGELAPDDAVRKAEQAIAAAPWLALADATQGYLRRRCSRTSPRPCGGTPSTSWWWWTRCTAGPSPRPCPCPSTTPSTRTWGSCAGSPRCSTAPSWASPSATGCP